jgi:hypothetical protein
MQVFVSELLSKFDLGELFQQAIQKRQNFMLKLRNAPWFDLVVEVTPAGEVSVAHYTQVNGDAWRDPEIVYEVRTWRAVEITQDPVARYRRAPAGHYLVGVHDLSRMWAGNLRDQGFLKVASAEVVYVGADGADVREVRQAK